LSGVHKESWKPSSRFESTNCESRTPSSFSPQNYQLRSFKLYAESGSRASPYDSGFGREQRSLFRYERLFDGNTLSPIHSQNAKVMTDSGSFDYFTSHETTPRVNLSQKDVCTCVDENSRMHNLPKYGNHVSTPYTGSSRFDTSHFFKSREPVEFENHNYSRQLINDSQNWYISEPRIHSCYF